jgi:hypothetical protein
MMSCETTFQIFNVRRMTLIKIGFTSYQTWSVTIRMIAYGVFGDLVDEYMCMSVTTYLESMYKFCKAVVEVSTKLT